jgi:hypothetical protein
VFRICKNDYHVSDRYNHSGERGSSVRYQSQITLIIVTVGVVIVSREKEINVPFG